MSSYESVQNNVPNTLLQRMVNALRWPNRLRWSNALRWSSETEPERYAESASLLREFSFR